VTWFTQGKISSKWVETGCLRKREPLPQRFTGARDPHFPLWVISGGAGPSPTRQVKLNERTLTTRTAGSPLFRSQEIFGKIPCPCPIEGLRFP
jgi:hypothetical protein